MLRVLTLLGFSAADATTAIDDAWEYFQRKWSSRPDRISKESNRARARFNEVFHYSLELLSIYSDNELAHKNQTIISRRNSYTQSYSNRNTCDSDREDTNIKIKVDTCRSNNANRRNKFEYEHFSHLSSTICWKSPILTRIGRMWNYSL